MEIRVLVLVNMIRDCKLLEKFEKDFIAKDKMSFEEAIKLFEAMWNEAISLNFYPLKIPSKVSK